MRQSPPWVLGRGVCKRSGLNPLRCERERRSNAHPLLLPILLSPSHWPHNLTVLLWPCTAQASSHDCMAWRASRGRAAVGATPHGKAHNGRGSAVIMLLKQRLVHVGGRAVAAVAVVVDGRERDAASCGWLEPRQGCWGGRPWPWMAAEWRVGAPG